MAEPHLARFRQTLKAAIEARQAKTASARQIIYGAMEKALERSVASHPERYTSVDLAALREYLRNAITSLEDDYHESDRSAGLNEAPAVPLRDHPGPTETEQKPPMAKSQHLVWALGLLGVITLTVAGYFLLDHGFASRAGGAEFEVSGKIPLVARKGFTVVADEDGFARLSATSDATVKDEVGVGAFLQLSSELEEKFSGRQVAIDISARSSLENGADHLSAAYFTQGVGNSGWRELPLESEFSRATFEFKVPERKGEPGKDFLGLVPGKLGQGGSVDIRSVQIRILK